jgi:uncharacterized protein with GYD domain
MAKYLLQVKYNADGLRGLAKEGAANRVEYIKQFAAGFGGTVESFNFALGEYDAYLVIDVDDASDITAASIAAGMGGSVSITTVALLTADQVDAAIAKIGDYRPPGA